MNRLQRLSKKILARETPAPGGKPQPASARIEPLHAVQPERANPRNKSRDLV